MVIDSQCGLSRPNGLSQAVLFHDIYVFKETTLTIQPEHGQDVLLRQFRLLKFIYK